MKYMAQYIGGHPRHPKDFYTTVTFLPESLVIGHNYEIVIPYHTITSIENTREKKFDIDRLVSFGPGGPIKKNHIYTVVKTREVPNIIPAMTIVIDFGPSGKLEVAQRILYDKMMTARKTAP